MSQNSKKVISEILVGIDKKLVSKIIDGLSTMDKKANIQKDKKGNVLFDKETESTEYVKWDESIEDYMAREVYPHVPDAVAFFEGKNINALYEDDMGEKTIKIGAEIPLSRYFYNYESFESSDIIKEQLRQLELSARKDIDEIL